MNLKGHTQMPEYEGYGRILIGLTKDQMLIKIEAK